MILNERFPELVVYDFDTGERFEPDYLLVSQKAKTDGYEQQQIFVEPKGAGFMPKDVWKEKFMLKMEQQAVAVKTYAEDNVYKIIGMPLLLISMTRGRVKYPQHFIRKTAAPLHAKIRRITQGDIPKQGIPKATQP